MLARVAGVLVRVEVLVIPLPRNLLASQLRGIRFIFASFSMSGFAIYAFPSLPISPHTETLCACMFACMRASSIFPLTSSDQCPPSTVILPPGTSRSRFAREYISSANPRFSVVLISLRFVPSRARTLVCVCMYTTSLIRLESPGPQQRQLVERVPVGVQLQVLAKVAEVNRGSAHWHLAGTLRRIPDSGSLAASNSAQTRTMGRLLGVRKLLDVAWEG